MVGDHGTIGYWNGTSLVFETSGTTATLRGVWAVDAEHVYAVGDSGTILLRQANVWQPVGPKVTPQVLTAVWGDTSGRVVAVGSNGTIVLGTTATGYKLVPNIDAKTTLPYSENLFGVTGTAGGPVFVVGALGILVQIDAAGTASTSSITSSSTKLLSGATTGANGSFFVGQQGQVFSSTAAGVTSVLGCPETALRAVTTTPGLSPVAWAAGWDGTICKIVGTTGTSFPYGDARWFNGIYAASPTALWVVGASGTLLHGLPTAPAIDGGAADAVVTDGAGLEGGG